MPQIIALGQRTQQLITQLRATQPAASNAPIAVLDGGRMTLTELIRWFNERPQAIINTPEALLLESLSASLLGDLSKSLPGRQPKRRKRVINQSNQLKYTLLAIAGIVFFGCEGFEGITAMLAVFSLPPLVVLAIGAFFALVAVLVFCGFGLAEIAKNLGIKTQHAPQVLDIYLREVKLITEIQQEIFAGLAKYSELELQDSLAIVGMLQKKHEALSVARHTVEELSNSSALQAAKFLTAGTAGIIFFGGGYFAGQTVVIELMELLFHIALAPTVLPVIVISLLVAFAAFVIYWHVERLGVETLITRYVGLDCELVEEFCHEGTIKNTTSSLQRLENGIQETICAKNAHKKVSEAYWKQVRRETGPESSTNAPSSHVQPANQSVYASSLLSTFHGKRLTRSASVPNLGVSQPALN